MRVLQVMNPVSKTHTGIGSLPRITALIWVLLQTTSSMFGQNSELPGIINFPKEDYAGQKQNWQIDQLPNGLMLFANTAGLMTYDGVNWSLYEMPHQQIIRTLLVDQDRIFVGSYGEFGYWAPGEDGDLIYRSLIDLMEHHLTEGEEIWNIFKIGEAIYFHSFGTLFKYDKDRLDRIPPPHSIRFMYPVDSQRYILQVTGHGIMEFSPDTFTSLLSQDALGSLLITSMTPVDQESVLIATERDGLFRFKNLQIRPWTTEADHILKTHQINKLLRLSNGLWAIGTISDGLIIMDPEGSVKFHINKNGGLQNNTVLALFEDVENHLWVGMDDGIALIDLVSPTTFSIDHSGKIGTLYAAIEYDDCLFIGTNQGLFSKSLDKASPENEFRLITGTQGQVWDLRIIDRVLFCGHNNGTYIVRKNQAEQISTITGGWHLIPVFDRDDKLIQGTYTGLITINKDGDTWSFGHSIPGFTEVVKQLIFDDEGWLWSANPYRGLHRLLIDFEKDSLLQMQTFSQINGLPSDYNISFIRFRNELLFLSGQQYYSFNAENNSFAKYPFPGHEQIRFDKIIPISSELFFIINQGQVEMIEGDQTVGKFNLNLVRGSENIVQLQDNKFLACLEDGYAIINPRLKQSDARPVMEATISSFKAWDRSGTLQMNLNCMIHLLEEPVLLSAGINRIEFQFASLDYSSNRRFRYRLDGFDPEWSPWTILNRKEYTNLTPGSYQLDLQYEGRAPIHSMQLIQKPAWHQTITANVLIFALIVSLGMFLLRYSDRRFKAHTRRLEIEKDREINRQRLSLKYELLEREIKHKSQELANSTMNIIQKNKALLKLREQITDVRSNLGKQFPDNQYYPLIRLIQQHMSNQDDWRIFETHFNDVHDNFFKTIKRDYPDLTSGELKLAAYLKMNLSTKEIAPLLSISIRGVENKRYRLRQKMGLMHDENLLDVLLKY